jgi:hypothetical protein
MVLQIFTKKRDFSQYVIAKLIRSLQIFYKNDISELSSVKNLEISYKSSVSSGKITSDFLMEILFKNLYNESSSKIGAIENEDEAVEVTIDMDGNTEFFYLKMNTSFMIFQILNIDSM